MAGQLLLLQVAVATLLARQPRPVMVDCSHWLVALREPTLVALPVVLEALSQSPVEPAEEALRQLVAQVALSQLLLEPVVLARLAEQAEHWRFILARLALAVLHLKALSL